MLFRLIRLPLLIIVAMVAGACASDAPTAPARPAEVVVNFLTPATVRRVTIQVSGPGISPPVVVNMTVGADSIASGSLTLSAGSARRFVVTAVDSAGVTTHRADSTITLLEGPNPPLALRLDPLPSSVGITVTFGGVRVTADTATRTVASGSTITLSANALTPSGASVPADSLQWGTSNPAIATVVAGVVTGVSAGTATIVVSYRGAAIHIPVVVASAPTPPEGLLFIGAGRQHGCALVTTTDVRCWGSNALAQLGNGTLTSSLLPVQTVSPSAAIEQMVVGNNMACVRLVSRGTECWGWNADGQLGNGTTLDRSVPTSVSGGVEFATLAASDSHMCGLTAAGTAYCWGANVDGQIGDGTTISRNTPVQVLGGLTFAQLFAGGYATCGLTSAGEAYCWGRNDHGGLGVGDNSDRTAPTRAIPSRTFTTMALGVDHTCGRTAAGETYCWGRNNNAQLGNGSTTGSLTASLVSGGHSFAKIFAAADHTCGLTAAGAAWCWGYNNFGQLGDGTTTSQSVPTLVQGGFAFSQLALGGTGWDGITVQPNHTCGAVIGGGARCWGRNASGQLGDGTTTDRLTPTAVALP